MNRFTCHCLPGFRSKFRLMDLHVNFLLELTVIRLIAVDLGYQILRIARRYGKKVFCVLYNTCLLYELIYR